MKFPTANAEVDPGFLCIGSSFSIRGICFDRWVDLLLIIGFNPCDAEATFAKGIKISKF